MYPNRRIAGASPPKPWACQLPAERVELIAPVLNELDRRLRASLDRDLSLVEPAHEFRPDGK